jgi:LPS-assembly lipoprotein
MSSSNKKTSLIGVMALTGFLSLTGCIRPLYGTDSQGQTFDERLSTINVEKVSVPQGQERLSHYLRAELVFDLDGRGRPSAKNYKLVVNATERVQAPIVNTLTGRAESATLIGQADYVLQSLDGKSEITSGRAFGSVTYDRNQQRFATVRAARDAEIKLAKLLSEQIKNRLASALVNQK